MDELVVIARIRKPHGVRGELLAESLTFDPSRFDKIREVTLRKDDKLLNAHLQSWRLTNQGILLKFVEAPDRTAAEELRGYEVCIMSSERLPLPDSEAYLDEIVGMSVVHADTAEELGTIEAVHSYPAGPVYDIRMKDGSMHSVTTAGEEVVSLSRQERVVRVRLLEAY